jgi:hypothetical protein
MHNDHSDRTRSPASHQQPKIWTIRNPIGQ